jgi:hypothetical protein
MISGRLDTTCSPSRNPGTAYPNIAWNYFRSHEKHYKMFESRRGRGACTRAEVARCASPAAPGNIPAHTAPQETPVNSKKVTLTSALVFLLIVSRRAPPPPSSAPPFSSPLLLSSCCPLLAGGGTHHNGTVTLSNQSGHVSQALRSVIGRPGRS